jgi:hypothetical protein
MPGCLRKVLGAHWTFLTLCLLLVAVIGFLIALLVANNETTDRLGALADASGAAVSERSRAHVFVHGAVSPEHAAPARPLELPESLRKQMAADLEAEFGADTWLEQATFVLQFHDVVHTGLPDGDVLALEPWPLPAPAASACDSPLPPPPLDDAGSAGAHHGHRPGPPWSLRTRHGQPLVVPVAAFFAGARAARPTPFRLAPVGVQQAKVTVRW